MGWFEEEAAIEASNSEWDRRVRARTEEYRKQDEYRRQGRLILDFPDFYLTHCRDTGETTTRYPDGGFSACPVVPDDSTHAKALGITPQQHRLAHELLHHLVGIHIYGTFKIGSFIIWNDAHGQPHREDEIGSGRGGWEEEEWLVTALTYRLFGKEPERDHGAWQWLVDRGWWQRAEVALKRARAALAGVGVLV